MANVALSASLSLDISAALAEVNRLEAALDAAAFVEVRGDAAQVTSATENAVNAADTDTLVTGDAAQVTSATEQAVDAADTDTVVTGDAAQVTSATEQAVDAADTDVTVTGDAADLTSVTESAVDAADTSVTVTGSVDPSLSAGVAGFRSEVESATDQVDQLGATTGRTTGEMGSGFRRVAQIVTAALGAAFVKVGVDYNSLLQTSRAAFTTLLGDAEAASAQLEELVEFARTSPFPRQAFIEATQVLLAFGVAAEDVVPTLSAIQDAVAATGGSADQIGEITFILAQIESTGKITAETLNQLGFRGINAAKLISEQMGVTENDIRESITRGTLDAREALDALVAGMTERFGGAAEGVKDTWEGALDRIRGALRDLSAAMVATFISPEGGGPAVVFANQIADALRRLEEGIVPAVQQMGGNLVPVLDALGNDLLPAVVDAMIALAPAFGNASVAVSGLAPLISALAAALNAIPEPVLQAVAVFALLQRIQLVNTFTQGGQALAGMVGQMRTASREAGGLRASLGGLVSQALSPAVLATAGLTAAFVLWSQQQQRNAERAAEQTARVQTLTDAIDEASSASTGLRRGFEQIALDGTETSRVMTAVGLSGARLTEILLSARDRSDALADVQVLLNRRFEEGGTFAGVMRDRLARLVDAAEEQAVATIEAAVATEKLTQAEAEEILSARNVVAATAAWVEQQKQLQAETDRATEAQIRAALAAGEISREQADAALASDDLTAAWQALQAEIGQQSTALEVAAEVTDRYADASGRAADQGRQWASDLQVLARLLNTADVSTEAVQGKLLDFALAAGRAEISSEDLEAVALSLGTTVEDLEFFIAEAAETVQEFADNASAGFRTVADVGKDLDDEFSLKKFRSELEDAVEANENFVENLEFLIDEGFPRLAQAAAELGPQATQRLAKDIRKGGEDVAAEAELLLERLGTQIGEDLPERLQAAGIRVAEATGAIGGLATEAFGTLFDPEAVAAEKARAATDAIGDVKDLATGAGRNIGGSAARGFLEGVAGIVGVARNASDRAVAAVGARVGAAGSAGRRVGLGAAGGLAGGVAGMPDTAGSAAARAVDAVGRRAGAGRGAGSGLGGAMTSGVRAGAAGMPGAVGSAVSRAVAQVNSPGNRGSARSGGVGLGAAIGDGLVSGIGGRAGAVAAAARRIALGAVGAAAGALATGSPSRVFEGLGHDIGDGLALGIADRERAVVAEAEGIARAAADAASVGLRVPVSVDPRVSAAAGGGGAAQGGGVTVLVQPGAVVVQPPAGAGVAEGRAVARATAHQFMDTVTQRQILVDARTA